MRAACAGIMLMLLFSNIAAAAALPQPPQGIRFYEIGAAPGFTLPDIDGETVTLQQFRGQWVLLHFWASWCGPCRREMPTLNRLDAHFDDSRLRIIMVNTAEDEDTIFSFTSELSMQLPTYMDRDGLVTEAWKPRGLPASFLIDPEGRVRYQAIGGREWDHPLYIDFLERLVKP